MKETKKMSNTGPTTVKRITAPEAPPDIVETRFAGTFRFK
jgi:hypothetical protein